MIRVKLVDMKKIWSNKLGFGAFVLLLSGVVCKALGALFRLPLTNLLGIEGIGIFQLVMSIYSFGLVVTCGGVTASLSKLIGAARAKGESSKITAYIHRAIFAGLSVGLLIGVVFLIFGQSISIFQGIVNNKTYMLFVLLLPLGSVLAALRGFFQGYENMLPTAISQIIEQTFKFALGLLFAFMFSKICMTHGVFGAFLGIVLSEVLALLFLIVVYIAKNKNKKKATDYANLKFARHEFDKANFALTLSASILPLVNAFDGLVIVSRLVQAGCSSAVATKLFGIQSGVVGAILNFPLIISMAVTTTLLPNISYLISRGTGGKHLIERGLKILLFLILPTTFGIIAISRQVFSLVYADMSGAMLDTAYNLMFFGGFSIVFTALMQYFLMLLQANGKFRYILGITALGGLAKAIVSFVLSAVPSINIYAIVFGNLAMTSIVSIGALVKLKKVMFLKIEAGSLFALLFGTFAMFLTVYTFINCNYFGTITNIILAIVLGVFVYLVLTASFSLKLLKKSFAKKSV